MTIVARFPAEDPSGFCSYGGGATPRIDSVGLAGDTGASAWAEDAE